jgi:MFS family permease
MRVAMQRRWTSLREAGWGPALPLVLVQLAIGIWYMPQLSFFPIYLREQLGLTALAVTIVVAIGQFAGMVTALGGGALADRLGSKWVLVLGLAAGGVSSLLFQLHAPWLVVALWAVASGGLALQTLGGSSYLTRLGARKAFGLLSAVYALSMTLGGALANLVAGLILDRSGFRAFGLVEVGLAALVALGAALFMTDLGDRAAKHAPLRSFWVEALPIVRKSLMQTLLGMRSLPTIFYGMSVVLIPLLLNDLTHSKTLVAAYATTNLIVASAAQLLAGRAADRFGARGPTLAGYGCLIFAALGLALTANQVWGLLAFGVLAIASAWGLSTLMYVWVSDGVPKVEQAWAFGLLHATWSLSMVIGSVLGGVLNGMYVGLPFLIGGLLNLGSLLLTMMYYGRVQPARSRA